MKNILKKPLIMTIDHFTKIKPQNCSVSTDEFGNVTDSFLEQSASKNNSNDTNDISLLDKFLTKIYCCVFWPEPWDVCIKSLCLFDCNVDNEHIKYSFCEPLEEGNCFCPHDFDYCNYTSNNHLDHYILACILFVIKVIFNIFYCIFYTLFLLIGVPIFLIALIPICIFMSIRSLKNILLHFINSIPYCNFCAKREINNDYNVVIQI